MNAEASKDDCWIRTYSGKVFNFMDIDPESIDMQDIGHALSLICRFTGHVKEFYSVAEHCIWVSNLAYKYALSGISGVSRRVSNKEAAKIGLYALLHDASEAYVTDLNSPAKSLLPDYKLLEHKIAYAINKKYGVVFEDGEPPQIKYADNTMLVAEAKALLHETDFSNWVNNQHDKSVAYRQIPMTPRQAEVSYLNRFATMLQMFIQGDNVVDMAEFKEKKEAALNEAAKEKTAKEEKTGE